MFWKLFKARHIANDTRIKYYERIYDLMDKRIALSKDVLKTALEEALSEDEIVSDILKICVDRSDLWDGVLELLNEDSKLAKRYKTKFLKKIIEIKDVERFLYFISEADLSESDIATIAEDDGTYKLLLLLLMMSEDSLKKFFRISSENEHLRRFINEHLEIVIVVIFNYPTDCSIAFGCIIDFFPDLISPLVQYILGRKEYSKNCIVELYALQLVVDSKYLLPYEEYKELYSFVAFNAWNILKKISSKCVENLHKVVWILKNEFEVSSDEIYTFLECLYEEEKDSTIETNCRFHIAGDDANKLGVLDSFLLISEGYDMLECECYKIVAKFPTSIVAISNIFPNVDEELLFKIAKDPNNQLLHKFM